MTRAVAPALALAALASAAAAQDRDVAPTDRLEAYIDGSVEERGIRIGQREWTGAPPVLWTDQISAPGADYVRLLLQVEGEPFPPGSRLVLVGTLGQEFEIPLDRIGPDGHWTEILPFGRVRLALVADGAVPEGSVLLLDKVAVQSGKLTPYSTHGVNQLTPVHAPDVPEAVRALAAPVAFLSFIDGGFARTCTGFLVEDDLLLTNQHCINSDETCRTMMAVFGYEFDADGRLGMGPQLRCAGYDPNFSYFALDVTAVRLAGRPGPDYSAVALDGVAAVPQGALVIVQHPGSQPKQVSILDCAAVGLNVEGRAAGTDFAHTCDTAGGSSGSPVFDASGNLVGIHHFGFEDGDAWSENRGVHGDLVVEWFGTALMSGVAAGRQPQE